MLRRLGRLVATVGGVTFATLVCGCESYFFLPGTLDGASSAQDGTVIAGEAFTEQLIKARTFVNGQSVTTVTHRAGDPLRVPFGIDFNRDGKIDPVVGYTTSQAASEGIIQILLSRGPAGTVDFVSLTLDSNTDWAELLDVAAGDIDNDGMPDVVAATQNGVVYMHHPTQHDTTDLRFWGSGETEGPEFIEGSTDTLSSDEIDALITDALPPGTRVEQYDIRVEFGVTNVEIGDMDADGNNDVIASAQLIIRGQPSPGNDVEPFLVITGSIQVFQNPGRAKDGSGWAFASVGRHERLDQDDREVATSLLVYDLDGDGLLDIVSAARADGNVQVAWFQNPGQRDFFATGEWNQYRIGSVRDVQAIDIADLTGDGRPDVVGTGGDQMQLMLFEQPAEGPARGYDWDSFPIVTFDNFEPRDVRALDIDNDGTLELVLGGTAGAVRYFEPPADPRQTWTGVRILDFKAPGDVGFVGFGDLDADGDFDLVTVVDDSSDDNGDRVSWIRNDVIR